MKKKLPGEYSRSQNYAAGLTAVQEEMFDVQAAGARWLWNKAAAWQQERWSRGKRESRTFSYAHAGPEEGISPRARIESYQELGYAVTVIRQEGYSFRYGDQDCPLTAIRAVFLHGALRQLSAGWDRHLAVRSKDPRSRPPGFRSKQGAQSLYWQTQEHRGRMRVISHSASRDTPHQGVIVVPALGPVKIRVHRELPADAVAGFACLKRLTDGRYQLTVQYTTRTVRPPASAGVTGVDRGTAVTAATSAGDFYNIPRLPPGLAVRKLKLEKALARKRQANRCRYDIVTTTKNGTVTRRHRYCPDPVAADDCRCWQHSNRYKQDRRAYEKICQHEEQMRKAASHEVSRVLADRYAVVVMENLDVSAMSRSAAGTEANPGKKVRQKAGRNREIMTSNWYQLEQFTGYKTRLEKVPAPYTSQTCPACGHVSGENRDRKDPDRQFRCTACGLAGHADVIAARNIEDRWRERQGADSAPGGCSQADQDREIVRTLGKNLLPWGPERPVARRKPHKRRSGRLKKRSPRSTVLSVKKMRLAGVGPRDVALRARSTVLSVKKMRQVGCAERGLGLPGSQYCFICEEDAT